MNAKARAIVLLGTAGAFVLSYMLAMLRGVSEKPEKKERILVDREGVAYPPEERKVVVKAKRRKKPE